MTVTESSWIFLMISRGVPAGAMKPVPGGDVEARQGLGDRRNVGHRFDRSAGDAQGLELAAPRELDRGGDAAKISGTWFASTSASPWPNLVRVDMSCCPPWCGSIPSPDAAGRLRRRTHSLFFRGCACTSAISSFTLFGANAGFAMEEGPAVTLTMGARSRTGS